jgi:hypothetical protein
MTLRSKILLGALMGVSALALSAAGASAAVACVGNVCWHTHERYEYPAHARVVVHEDGWKWGRHEHYRWREHDGRGYWNGRRWTSW